MFAAHLAAGLTIKAIQPKAPAWAVLSAAFLPDLVWITCAGAGLEPASDAAFFDGWSHSAVSILIEAILFSACFASLGRAVTLAVGAAILSHLPLDMLIHPQPLELWPHSSVVLGVSDWQWGQVALLFGKSRYWWIQLAVTLPLLAIYCIRSVGRADVPLNLVAASIIVVLGLHLLL